MKVFHFFILACVLSIAYSFTALSVLNAKEKSDKRDDALKEICLSNLEGDNKYTCLAVLEKDATFCKMVSAPVLKDNCFKALR